MSAVTKTHKEIGGEIGEEDAALREFSLEAVVRSAARRMVQGALEAEVTEFLGRLRGVRLCCGGWVVAGVKLATSGGRPAAERWKEAVEAVGVAGG